MCGIPKNSYGTIHHPGSYPNVQFLLESLFIILVKLAPADTNPIGITLNLNMPRLHTNVLVVIVVV